MHEVGDTVLGVNGEYEPAPGTVSGRPQPLRQLPRRCDAMLLRRPTPVLDVQPMPEHRLWTGVGFQLLTAGRAVPDPEMTPPGPTRGG